MYEESKQTKWLGLKLEQLLRRLYIHNMSGRHTYRTDPVMSAEILDRQKRLFINTDPFSCCCSCCSTVELWVTFVDTFHISRVVNVEIWIYFRVAFILSSLVLLPIHAMNIWSIINLEAIAPPPVCCCDSALWLFPLRLFCHHITRHAQVYLRTWTESIPLPLHWA